MERDSDDAASRRTPTLGQEAPRDAMIAAVSTRLRPVCADLSDSDLEQFARDLSAIVVKFHERTHPAKADLLRDFFGQVESQVQFGDNKAQLLVAGDAILLAFGGALLKMVSDCLPNDFAFACAGRSPALWFALAGSASLATGLVCALWAARPSTKHASRPREFFLISHVGDTKDPTPFVNWYRKSSDDELLTQVLITIHGKAEYATAKFRRLGYAVNLTLGGLILLAVSAFLATL